MKVLFLDESGDHNLSVIDPLYPVFVLGGVIMDYDYACNEVAAALDQFKMKMFGTKDIVLHTADIARNRAGFERLKDKGFREAFYVEMNAIMAGLNYQVVACVIHKDVHLQRYGLAAVDPYMLSLDILVERFCLDVGPVTNGGVIVAETRGSTLDRGIELAWLNLKIQGTRFMQATNIERRVRGLHLRDKREYRRATTRRSGRVTHRAMCLASPENRTGTLSKASCGAVQAAELTALDWLSYPKEGPAPLRSD
ncbi:DUF3800 domain-containing protein [Hankyongella ginsenosidimutans]|uniref:DUF3800 domain-containing protein n=1 Tax=Hankyongella ginsenosidimutans TaxID=1763828 RepID=A0A4D7BZ67_9SPHN|nr:DUF3800 domain-containing protein [Hankyongella ginsenosidimutans]QCI78784.1 DUF3800 domain-containing protein [Hankyongella ginsenosidimutans]